MRLSASLSALGGAAIILFRYGMSLAPHRKVLGALPRRGMRSVQRYIAAPDWPLCSSFGRTSSRGLDLVEFRRLGLVDSLIDGLRDQGFREPSPIQRAAIPEALSGHNLAFAATTGQSSCAPCAEDELSSVHDARLASDDRSAGVAILRENLPTKVRNHQDQGW